VKVFWAWQYDLPGKIARHFIRGALEEAIRQINQTEDIDEPNEAFQTGAMHLDYGRKNLKGSPDLAIEILKKIDNATVFVGDVTPVGKGQPYKTDEGVESDGKLLMNPNVAIELGYALKTLTTENVLMVMNGHYGKRSDMPFDLGHKGGPIIYNLRPGAQKEEIAAEKKKLVAILVEALSEYVPRPVPVPFDAMKPKIGRGIYFDDGEILAENKRDADKTKFYMPFRKVMWLRVIPSAALPMPLDIQTLMQNIGSFRPFGLPVGMECVRQNGYGAAYFSAAGNTNNIDNITQHTRDGEIWGVNADILRQGERGEYQYVFSLPMENLFITSLTLYVDFLQRVSNVPAPVQIEAGIEGIKGRTMAHNGSVLGTGGVMHRDSVTHSDVLRSFDKAEQDRALLDFFRKVYANTGVPRPAGFYGRG
jgi:hypothetical protein